MGKTMETAQHTPGPWKIIALEPDETTRWHRLQIQHHPDEDHRLQRSAIADVLFKFEFQEGREEAAANARLIATAPEMLALLKEIEESPAGSAKSGMEFKIRQLIAKAEGRS